MWLARSVYGFHAPGVGVMPGPPPKPAGQRRRRNKTVAPVKLPSDPGVDCPPLHDEGRLMPATVAWWETVWASPMASQFLSCDVPTLERLADLIDRTHRGESGSRLLAEIRALEDRFGLSPLARRRLQWEMPSAEAFGELTPPVDLDEERFLRALD